MISDVIQQNKQTLRIGAVVFLLFISGILFAFFLPSTGTAPTTNEQPRSDKQPPLFSDLRIGTPVRASFANQKNPPIKQKTEYTVNELIMLQGTTTPSAPATVDITARLVDEKGTVISLSPSTITLAKGTNSFCCWNIKNPGEYTMQLFRPDSVVTRLPIKIIRDFESSTSN